MGLPPPQPQNNAKASSAKTGARARCGRRVAKVSPASPVTKATLSRAAMESPRGALALAVPPAKRPAIEGAVVVTLTVKGVGVPLTARLEGVGVQIARFGAPLQVRVTEPVKPLEGVTCRL